MAQYGINARIIDKRGTKIFNGQADGLRPRTQELFDSMGFQDRVSRESKISYEFHVWVTYFHISTPAKMPLLNWNLGPRRQRRHPARPRHHIRQRTLFQDQILRRWLESRPY